MVTDDEILARILYKLLNNKCFSRGHMLLERIISSVPKHERGRAKDILKQAVKRGLILVYGDTGHGIAYQLNIEKLDEISDFIKRNFAHSSSMKQQKMALRNPPA